MTRMSWCSWPLLVTISAVLGMGCRASVAPAPGQAVDRRAGEPTGGGMHSAEADGASAGSTGTSGAGGLATGSGRPSPLGDCAPVGGAGESPTTVSVPGDGGTKVTVIGEGECWYRSVCSRPEPDGGTITLSCKADVCRCVFETSHPQATTTISFVVKDACQDARELLRRRCGGG